MKELIVRIIELKRQASELQEDLIGQIPDDDLIGTPLYNVEAACDEVMGKIFIHLHGEGKVKFTGEPKGLLPAGKDAAS